MTHATYITAVKLASKAVGLPMPESEFWFAKHLGRKFRFDFCYPDRLLSLEVEGGVWIKGRHTRGSGFLDDMEKYNLAASLGYRVWRCTPQTVGDLTLWRQIAHAYHDVQEAA